MQLGPSLVSSSELGLVKWEGFLEYASVGTSVDYERGSCANPEQSVEGAWSLWMIGSVLSQRARWVEL